jgi:hypothetical protein
MNDCASVKQIASKVTNVKVSLRSLHERMVDLVIVLLAIYGLSSLGGHRSWTWTFAIAGLGLLAIVINRSLVWLYAKYGPDRLADTSTHIYSPNVSGDNKGRN